MGRPVDFRESPHLRYATLRLELIANLDAHDSWSGYVLRWHELSGGREHFRIETIFY